MVRLAMVATRDEERQFHRLNAAALSVYSHAHQRHGRVAGPWGVGMTSLAEATETVIALLDNAVSDRVAEAAERVRCLSVAALATTSLRPDARSAHSLHALRRLAGRDFDAVKQYVEEHVDRDGDGRPDRSPRQRPLARGRLASALMVASARSQQRPRGAEVGTGRQLPRLTAPPPSRDGHGARVASRQALPPEPSVMLDPGAMVTTVPALGHYYGNLKQMAPTLDPRSWSLTAAEYWSVSRRLKREGNRFVPLDVGGFDPPLGQSWSGLFEERVVMCASDGILSGYTNRLLVDFRVSVDDPDPTQHSVWVGFSLYQCDSSVQLMRFAPSGMDIDEGYALYTQSDQSRYEPIAPFREPGDLLIDCECVKRVRYTDLLSRRTAGQGGLGAGEVVNYLAPGVLGLWLDYVVAAGPHAGMTRARLHRTALEAPAPRQGEAR